jgi:hypothetical protein
MTISFKNKNHLSTKVMNNISPWVVCCVYTFTSCASTSSVFILYFTNLDWFSAYHPHKPFDLKRGRNLWILILQPYRKWFLFLNILVINKTFVFKLIFNISLIIKNDQHLQYLFCTSLFQSTRTSSYLMATTKTNYCFYYLWYIQTG